MINETLLAYTKRRLKTNKVLTTIVGLYLLFCIGSAIYFLVVANFRNVLICLSFLVFGPLVYIVEYYFHIELVTAFMIVSVFLAAGSLAGSCFDFYNKISIFDDLLHGTSGFIFACLGFSIINAYLKNKTDSQCLVLCISFAACFSLAIALMWELFEWGCSSVFGNDMEEDSIVTNFHSFFLAGSHNRYVEFNNIIETFIHYGDDEWYHIDGYLDLGLYDTLTDMLVCFIGTTIFVIMMAFNNVTKGKITKLFIPKANRENTIYLE